MNFNNVFKGKKVLITGHTGFKGTWLTIWLANLGAEVTGISLEPNTDPSHFLSTQLHQKINDIRCDIRKKDELEKIIIDLKPDFVFHLAAQALVRLSYSDPVTTWETNVIGTLNVLDSLRNLKNNCTAIFITSDKCYDNVEWLWGYRETDPLGGPDPYSASKGAAELVIKSYIKSFFPDNGNIRVASVRAGNVIGGGDWSADRIIPDCIKAWVLNKEVNLRNPHSTRPWQHVLEPLSGYLCLAANLSERNELHGEPFNFGPAANQNFTVLELVKEMSIHWDKVKWEKVLDVNQNLYESGLLKLNCDKALHLLNWHAFLGFNETVRLTSEWYKSYYNKTSNIYDLTKEQIEFYTNAAIKEGLKWAI